MLNFEISETLAPSKNFDILPSSSKDSNISRKPDKIKQFVSKDGSELAMELSLNNATNQLCHRIPEEIKQFVLGNSSELAVELSSNNSTNQFFHHNSSTVYHNNSSNHEISFASQKLVPYSRQINDNSNIDNNVDNNADLNHELTAENYDEMPELEEIEENCPFITEIVTLLHVLSLDTFKIKAS